MKKRLCLLFIISALLFPGCGNNDTPSEPTHHYEETWTHDENTHWHACTDSGYENLKSDEAPHTFTDVVTDPTFSNGGYTTHTCSVCDYSYVDSETEKLVPEKTVSYKVAASLNPDKTEGYTFELPYSDELFKLSAKNYHKDLSLLSSGLAFVSSYVDDMNDFFSQTGFVDAIYHGYEEAPTADSVAYTFAHKQIDDFELFVISPRGLVYGLEWVNNFTVGASGDHEGFLARANDIHNELKTYVANHKGNKEVKYWIAGYSRAGAISNVLASLLLRENNSDLEDDLFAYTFEAPSCVSVEHAIKYPNVHNIINSSDLVARVLPDQYGLARCGIDYDIYNKDEANIIKEFDPDISFSDFVEMTINNVECKDDVQVLETLLDSVYNAEPSEEQWAVKTREQYATVYQDSFAYMLGNIFALSASTRSSILTDLTKDYSVVFSILGDSTGAKFADFIKTYLDKDEITYDYDTLVGHCAVMLKAIIYLFGTVISTFMVESNRPGLMRLINVHYPESVYSLLTHAHKNIQ